MAQITEDKKKSELALFYKRITDLLAARGHDQALKELKAVPFKELRKSPALLNAFGVALRASGQSASAITMYNFALQIDPRNSGTWSNLGNAFKDANFLAASIAAHQKALACAAKPSVQLWHNQGLAFSNAGQHSRAIHSFEQAIALAPKSDYLRWDLSRSQLALGDYEQGFFNYQYRWNMDEAPPRRVFGREWDGSPLPAETPLFVYVEQGFGDYIQCARYLKTLPELVASFEVEVKPELESLMRHSFPHIRFVKHQEQRVDKKQELVVSLLDLPRYVMARQTLDGAPYLHAPAAREELAGAIAQNVKARKAKHIGIVWSGSTTFKRNQYRAAPLEWFASTLSIPGAVLHSLQMGPRAQDLRKLPDAPISEQLVQHIASFADSAHAVQSLDLVITTCTSIVHLCGALGVPCWVLLDYSPHWLWGPSALDSPWYKSVRLWRQTAPGDWRSVFDQVASELMRSESPPP